MNLAKNSKVLDYKSDGSYDWVAFGGEPRKGGPR